MINKYLKLDSTSKSMVLSKQTKSSGNTQINVISQHPQNFILIKGQKDHLQSNKIKCIPPSDLKRIVIKKQQQPISMQSFQTQSKTMMVKFVNKQTKKDEKLNEKQLLQDLKIEDNQPLTTPHSQATETNQVRRKYESSHLNQTSIQDSDYGAIKLFLKNDSQQKTYYARKEYEKEEIIHWGQRKLLIAETLFLTEYGQMSKNVIYVGAAPGYHIQLLAEMFDTHRFYLFDPNEFFLKQNDRISVFQKLFTDIDAENIKQKFKNDYLFISDIRTANFRQMTPLENEQAVLRDNELQMKWVEILQPQKAFLKFRCAYPTEIQEPTIFFEGDLLIQPWAPRSSTETRLIPSSMKRIAYDNLKYEQQMFYHNDVERKDDQSSITWDEKAEAYILTSYMLKVRQISKRIRFQVDKLQRVITQKLNQIQN